MKLIRRLLEEQAVKDFKSLIISLFEDCKDDTGGTFNLEQGLVTYKTMPYELLQLLNRAHNKLYKRLNEYFLRRCSGSISIVPFPDRGLGVIIQYTGGVGRTREAELTFELDNHTMGSFVELKIDGVNSFDQLIAHLESKGVTWRAAELA